MPANWGTAVTYNLIVADNSHDAERLHARRLRVERRVAARVTKDNVRVNVGIEVRDAERPHGVLEGGLALASGVIGTSTSRVVGAITVNIQVVIIACAALEENSAGQVATVCRAAAKSARQLVGTCP